MAIEAGQQLLHYRLLEKIGEGGMGVVWKALDTTLDRDVAIKVLPAAVADDADRLARLEREAKLLASLNHPNVATVHGLHNEGEVRFLAMELVAGEDLSARLEHGPIPMDEAIEIARQIAEGLEAAHAAGVIHRDLKPANIRLTTDRRVKVLDFGLARALAHDPASSGASPTLLPTVTSSGTQVGTILGTAAYMSPEQARGRAADRRADVWAFGVVLYEMLSNRSAFKSDTFSDTLASVLKLEPDLDALPPDLPRRIRRLLVRCLQKDRRKRLHHIADVRIVLDEALAGVPDEEGPEEIGTGRNRRKERSLWIGAIAVVAAVAVTVGWYLRPAPPEPPHRKIRLALNDGEPDASGLTAARISPDGKSILYTRGDKVFVRDLDSWDSREIQAAAGGEWVRWSHDGRSIGFVRDETLWRVSADGSGSSVIHESDWSINGVSWGPDGKILVTVEDDEHGGLYEVPERGGEPVRLPVAEPEDGHFHNAHVLPGGRGLLVTVHRGGTMAVSVAAHGEVSTLVETESRFLPAPFYATSGHVLYTRGGNNEGIWALPFSLDSLKATGEPFFVVAGGIGGSVSDDGTLIYREAKFDAVRRLVWVDRQGEILGQIGQPRIGYDSPSLSPDGRKVVVGAGEDSESDLWIEDLKRGTQTRLTNEERDEFDAVWTRDGKQIIYRKDRKDERNTIMIRNVDGSGEPRTLTEGDSFSLSPDGKYLVFSRHNEENHSDLWYMELENGAEPVLFMSTEHNERRGRVSPDGAYLAYESNESGQFEIYIKRFPSAEGKWLVSLDGGALPRWSPKGDELFWVDGDDKLIAVEVRIGPELILGKPGPLFPWNLGTSLYRLEFDISHDAQRFVLVAPEAGQESKSNTPALMMVENWLGE